MIALGKQFHQDRIRQLNNTVQYINLDQYDKDLKLTEPSYDNFK